MRNHYRIISALLLSLFLLNPSFAGEISKIKQLKNLADEICGHYVDQGSNMVPAIKKSINYFMHNYFDYVSSPSKADIIGFLNKHKNQMTCEGGKNYMMVALDRESHMSLFRALFTKEIIILEPTMQHVDINAVSLIGKSKAPMTVLDYMDDIIKSKNKEPDTLQQIEDIRDMYVESFNAKKFSELSKKEQAPFLK